MWPYVIICNNAMLNDPYVNMSFNH